MQYFKNGEFRVARATRYNEEFWSFSLYDEVIYEDIKRGLWLCEVVRDSFDLTSSRIAYEWIMFTLALPYQRNQNVVKMNFLGRLDISSM